MNKYILIHLILSFLYCMFFVKSSAKGNALSSYSSSSKKHTRASLRNINKQNNDEFIYKFTLVLFIPILGFLYIVILDILNLFNNDFSSNIDDDKYTDYIKLNISPSKDINYAKDVNIVPIEEALLINDNSVKRSLLIDILKENPSEHIKALKTALENEDSETSHYAASALSEIKSKFYIEVQKASINYENNKSQIKNNIAYVDILKKYIESGLLDNNNCRKYKYTLSLALENLLSLYKDNEDYYIYKINYDLDLGEFLNVQKYCSEFFKEYPNNQWSYLMYMKFYYSICDNKNFHDTLDSLKKTNIKLSNEALNIIRFWLEGE